MKNAEAPQAQAPPGQRLSLWGKLRQSSVWRSIFRQNYPDTDENRALVMVNSFFIHIHPVKVSKHSLRISYTWGLGIISAILLLILGVSGAILMFHYVPSTVTFGMLLRNMHRWAAHLMVLVVFLHMCRVFYTGGYKRPREFNWAIGVILWVTTLLLSFTGYLLPFDQLSYWAITIASQIAGYVPLIGEQARFYLLGGATVGQATLLRFYSLHVFLLPAILLALLGVHFWRIRKDGGLSAPLTEFTPLPVELPAVGPAGPGSGEKSEEISLQRPEKTYGLMALVKRVSPMVEKGPENTVFSWPHLMVMELLATLGTTVLLFIMSLLVNAPLREVANPAITEDPAKAPWFFSALQELLLHMHPTLAGVVITSVTLIGLMAIPYLDRHRSDIGIWFASKKGRTICLWSALYTAIAVIGVVLFDEFVGIQSIVGSSVILKGWLAPLGITFIVLAVLYLGLRRWHPNSREIALAYFTAFVVTYIVLTIIMQFFRGEGMQLIPLWDLPPGGLSF